MWWVGDTHTQTHTHTHTHNVIKYKIYQWQPLLGNSESGNECAYNFECKNKYVYLYIHTHTHTHKHTHTGLFSNDKENNELKLFGKIPEISHISVH